MPFEEYISVAYYVLGFIMMVVATLYGVAWVAYKIRRWRELNKNKS